MKKIVLTCTVFLILLSCSIDDETTTFTQELVPVTSVVLPDTLVFQQSHTFEITYAKPSNCHVFAGYIIEKDQNELIIGVKNNVYSGENCELPEAESVTKELEFNVVRDDFYIFKFWQGENENGEPVYLTQEVPVEEE